MGIFSDISSTNYDGQDLFVLLQNQSSMAPTQWLFDSVFDYLDTSEDHDEQCRLLSIAWVARTFNTYAMVNALTIILEGLTSTSDQGIDTVLLNLCRARVALGEGRLASHNTHWICATLVLEAIPGFREKGVRFAKQRLSDLLPSGKIRPS